MLLERYTQLFSDMVYKAGWQKRQWYDYHNRG